jgi:hypothetical protein
LGIYFKIFNAFCKENGVVKQPITPYVLKQNGVGERNNWTLVEMDFGLCFKKNIKNVIMGNAHFDEDVNQS